MNEKIARIVALAGACDVHVCATCVAVFVPPNAFPLAGPKPRGVSKTSWGAWRWDGTHLDEVLDKVLADLVART